MEVLKELFERHFGAPADRVQPLRNPLGGSGRGLVRLANDRHTAMGVLSTARAENVAFLEFSRHFRRHGLPVPEIYAVDLERNAYLEEDLGDTTLFEFLAAHREGGAIAPEVIAAYRNAIAWLPRFQVEAGRDLDYSVCHPRASFDGQSIAWDLNYFKYYFLQAAGTPFHEQALEDDFVRLTAFLLEADRDYFLYRDFQSRNIMWRDGRPFFLDYQGGRRGALQYDIASILYDAKADLPPARRQQLLDHYLDVLAGTIDLDRARFMQHYYGYVYIRIMQAMGAYGFRGFFERKPLFLESVPYALRNLRWLLDQTELPVRLPALMQVFRDVLESEKLPAAAPSPTVPLTVRIYSFSYRQGPPPDESGHGGGFVFDVRSVPNPGREERFKPLTGRDAPVIDHLLGQESARRYLADATSLVDASVRAYQQRGFDSLSVAFGCTGGQHRSVYMAERLAEHLRRKPGVQVIVSHRGLEKLGK